MISIKLLEIKLNFTPQEMVEKILDLCKLNNCVELARVRLAVFRDSENSTGYTIEAVGITDQNMQWNEEGFVIDMYPYARKACDVFANLKTANYLPYVMADIYAKENDLDEVLVLNSYNNICDASKTNIFCIKDKTIFTPAMDQGCVNGVMRRFVIEENQRVHQA
ncbi:MAG: hypothetical protein EOO89_15140, partial [Pedobacter sp.]